MRFAKKSNLHKLSDSSHQPPTGPLFLPPPTNELDNSVRTAAFWAAYIIDRGGSVYMNEGESLLIPDNVRMFFVTFWSGIIHKSLNDHFAGHNNPAIGFTRTYFMPCISSWMSTLILALNSTTIKGLRLPQRHTYPKSWHQTQLVTALWHIR
jgi:hypothetical protein